MKLLTRGGLGRSGRGSEAAIYPLTSLLIQLIRLNLGPYFIV